MILMRDAICQSELHECRCGGRLPVTLPAPRQRVRAFASQHQQYQRSQAYQEVRTADHENPSILERAFQAIADNAPRTDKDRRYSNDPTKLTLNSPALPKDRPQFIRPHETAATAEELAELPMMLYIPGIDGTGLVASRQFPTLARAFDLRAFSIPPADRHHFQQLLTFIIDYLEEEVGNSPVERPIYLLGESMGAIASLAVASERPDLVDRVVIVNPATSYPRSIAARLGPLLPRLSGDVYKYSPTMVAVFLGNPVLMAAAEVDQGAPIFTQIQQMRKGIEELIPLLLSLPRTLPGPTLTWRLKIMEEGCQFVEPRLKKIQQRVLCLASQGDWLLPSEDEGQRLKKKLPRLRLKLMPLRSHALLQEAGVGLVEIMEEQGFYTKKRTLSAPLKARSKLSFGEAVPIELPTMREHHLDCEGTVSTIDRLSSPVWFSTAEDGRVMEGLSGIPEARPLLLVGNHQTTALDLASVVGGLFRQKGILARGLAHPTMFQDRPTLQSGSNFDPRQQEEDAQAFSSFMQTYGAVQVGGRSFYKLMQNNEAILLYPGGAMEAFKLRHQKYRLRWPDRSEFVRMAAKFEATIVPFAGVGVEDSISMIADSEEIQRIPIYGQRAVENARAVFPSARRGSTATMDELFIGPITAPTSIQRLYFRFMKPIQLKKSDAQRSDELYRQVKSEVETGIEYLLHQRERDPYKDFVSRAIYEASWGKQAPTFPV